MLRPRLSAICYPARFSIAARLLSVPGIPQGVDRVDFVDSVDSIHLVSIGSGPLCPQCPLCPHLLGLSALEFPFEFPGHCGELEHARVRGAVLDVRHDNVAGRIFVSDAA